MAYALTVSVFVLCVGALLFSSARSRRAESGRKGGETAERAGGCSARSEENAAPVPQNEEKPAFFEPHQERVPANGGRNDIAAPAPPSFSVPPAAPGATILLVIDDAGQSAERTKRYAELPFPLTIAVLPRLPQARVCAEAVLAGGKELILHQPMQAMDARLDPGDGAVRVGMTKEQIQSVVRENLRELGGGVKGMNNHEGSLITADFEKIGYVLDVCREQGVYFLDSRTTSESQAVNAAFARGMQIWEKAGPYIDNEVSRERMLGRIYETLDYANRHGRAVVIAHVDKSAHILPRLLEELYPHLKEAGYTFATPSGLE